MEQMLKKEGAYQEIRGNTPRIASGPNHQECQAAEVGAQETVPCLEYKTSVRAQIATRKATLLPGMEHEHSATGANDIYQIKYYETTQILCPFISVMTSKGPAR